MFAREEKGILGIDYNKSPKAFIRATNDKGSYGTCEEHDSDVCIPTFKDVPMVEQIDTTSVKVSWPDTVTNLECGDNFMVKTMNAENIQEYKLSIHLPISQFSYIVNDLDSNKAYKFQVTWEKYLSFLKSSLFLGNNNIWKGSRS